MHEICQDSSATGKYNDALYVDRSAGSIPTLTTPDGDTLAPVKIQSDTLDGPRFRRAHIVNAA